MNEETKLVNVLAGMSNYLQDLIDERIKYATTTAILAPQIRAEISAIMDGRIQHFMINEGGLEARIARAVGAAMLALDRRESEMKTEIYEHMSVRIKELLNEVLHDAVHDVLSGMEQPNIAAIRNEIATKVKEAKDDIEANALPDLIDDEMPTKLSDYFDDTDNVAKLMAGIDLSEMLADALNNVEVSLNVFRR